MRMRKIFKPSKIQKKNERTCQHAHIENHVYASKCRRTYVCHVRQLSKPDGTLKLTVSEN